MTKKYQFVSSVESIRDLYILLEDTGLTDKQIDATGDKLLEAGKLQTKLASYKLASKGLYVAYKWNGLGALLCRIYKSISEIAKAGLSNY